MQHYSSCKMLKSPDVVFRFHRPLGQVLIAISKNFNKTGRLPQHDPISNKLQSQVSKAVNSAIEANLEKKLATYAIATSVSYSGYVASLTSSLVRGDASVNECTGILIKPKKLRFAVTWSNAAPYNTVRMLIFRWHDASAPVASGILQTTGGAFAPLSPISWVNHRKITVLHDQTLALYDHGATVAAKSVVVTINPGNAPIQLPLNGSGVTPQMDGLYFLLISDDAIAPQPIADVYAALTYTDA